MSTTRQRLLGEILRDVSRAFYLTLRVLPPGVREPIGVAYLLARAADTIADTAAVAPTERLRCLLDFRQMLDDGFSAERAPAAALYAGAHKGERALLAA